MDTSHWNPAMTIELCMHSCSSSVPSPCFVVQFKWNMPDWCCPHPVCPLLLQHVDEEQLLYTFCRPGGGAIQCSFQEGEMLLLSVEGVWHS